MTLAVEKFYDMFIHKQVPIVKSKPASHGPKSSFRQIFDEVFVNSKYSFKKLWAVYLIIFVGSFLSLKQC